jgi:quercetin dioxygenase-like cupin family protein
MNTFEPGARTAWDTHPLGQMLFVTAGLGWVQLARSLKVLSTHRLFQGTMRQS